MCEPIDYMYNGERASCGREEVWRWAVAPVVRNGAERSVTA